MVVRRRLLAGLDLGDVDEEVRAPALGFVDHCGQPIHLLAHGRDLAVHAGERVDDDRPPLARVIGRPESGPVASPHRLVLEELADLGEAEPGVVAEALDEAQAVDIVLVEEPIGTLGPSRRLEQTEFLVIADGARCQAEGCADLLDPEQTRGWRRGWLGGRKVGLAHAPEMMPQPCRSRERSPAHGFAAGCNTCVEGRDNADGLRLGHWGMLHLKTRLDELRLRLWFLPAIFALAAITLGFVLLAVDHRLATEPGHLLLLYGGTAEGARSVLSAISQSMLTFTALVFTITMLVLQNAASQLSPRVMRTFLRDRANQVVLGLFVATFLYAFIVLRDVRSPVADDTGFVPGLSIFVAFVLLLASVGAFVYYIDHMAHAIRASSVITSIATETEQALDRLFPDPVGTATIEENRRRMPDGGDVTLAAPRAGVLVAVNVDRLFGLTSPDRGLELIPAVGEFVTNGSVIAVLWGQWDRPSSDQARQAIVIDDERTLEQDAAFGFRQLVDIAVRALSPGINDPTTAVQALQRLHDLLRRLVAREIPAPERRDAAGRLRLVLPRTGWDGYVELAIDEIRLAGAAQIQVARFLGSMLDDLLSVAPADRQPVLRRELGRLAAGIDRSFPDAADATSAARSSMRLEH